MAEDLQIRADYDAETITVYQAYRPEIADAAAGAGRFVDPFSFTRATWIKPSFAWMMYRCGWATKPGQERVLAVRIGRDSFEAALDRAVLTSNSHHVYASHEEWQRAVANAPVRVQWDPERSLSGELLACRSIQIGLTRDVVHEYNDWIVGIEDITARVREIHDAVTAGRLDEAHELAPRELAYPVAAGRFAHLGLPG